MVPVLSSQINGSLNWQTFPIEQELSVSKKVVIDILDEIISQAVGANEMISGCQPLLKKSPRCLQLADASLNEQNQSEVINKALITNKLFKKREVTLETVKGPLKTFRINSKEFFIQDLLGSGVYGNVFKAVSEDNNEVAVKINKIFKDFKTTAHYFAALRREADCIKKITYFDPDDHYSIVRFVSSTPLDANRFCLVESYCALDLHQLVLKTKKIGLSLRLVCTIAKQLFTTLAFFKSSLVNLIHCDLKPQNILVDTSGKFKIRIADFGSSRPSPQINLKGIYLVTRYYRAPEILLSLPFDHSLDLWSAAAILFELHTTKPLFQATDNAELLRMFFELMGPIPGDLIKNFPDWENLFIKYSPDKDLYIHKTCLVARKNNVRHLLNSELKAKIKADSFNSNHNCYHTDENYELFIDLLMSIFKWRKEERVGPLELLDHPFIRKIDQITSDVSEKK